MNPSAKSLHKTQHLRKQAKAISKSLFQIAAAHGYTLEPSTDFYKAIGLNERRGRLPTARRLACLTPLHLTAPGPAHACPCARCYRWLARAAGERRALAGLNDDGTHGRTSSAGLVDEDVGALLAIHADPRLLRYYAPELATLDHARMLVDPFMRWANEIPWRWHFQFAIIDRDSNTLLGSCGVAGWAAWRVRRSSVSASTRTGGDEGSPTRRRS